MLIEIDDIIEFLLKKHNEGFNFFEEFSKAIDSGAISEDYSKYKFHGFFSKSNIDFWELLHMDLPKKLKIQL